MAELRPGDSFGKYLVEGVLGRGGMGVVYRALEQGGYLERHVALKVILPHLAGDAGFRDRFRHEARRAAALDHPAILPVYEADELDGQPYIAMRLVDGSDLSVALRLGGPMEPPIALTALRQVASALDYAHARGVVHRDVKPGNVLLARSGDAAFLTDFGLTREVASSGMTSTGTVIGTVSYMAPEQAAGARGVDGRADQYALACTLYEALTGRPPFVRDSDLAVLLAHQLEPAPTLSTAQPALAGADAELARALAKDPGERWPSCADLIDGVGAALANAATAQLPSGGASTLTQRMPAPASGHRRRRRVLAPIAAAAILAAGIAAAVAAMRDDDDGRRSETTSTSTAQSSTAASGTGADTSTTNTTEPDPCQRLRDATWDDAPCRAEGVFALARRGPGTRTSSLYTSDFDDGRFDGSFVLHDDGARVNAVAARFRDFPEQWARTRNGVVEDGCVRASTGWACDAAPENFAVMQRFALGWSNFEGLGVDPDALPKGGRSQGMPMVCVPSAGSAQHVCVRRDGVVATFASASFSARLRDSVPRAPATRFAPPAPEAPTRVALF